MFSRGNNPILRDLQLLLKKQEPQNTVADEHCHVTRVISGKGEGCCNNSGAFRTCKQKDLKLDEFKHFFQAEYFDDIFGHLHCFMGIVEIHGINSRTDGAHDIRVKAVADH